MPGTADASARPPTTRRPPSNAMPGTADDALLASADADKAVSDPDGLEHLPGSVEFQVEAIEPDRLSRLLASVDATPTEISDPDGLDHLGWTVGFQVEANRSNRLLASANSNLDPYELEQLAGMLMFGAETTTECDHLITAADSKSNLTICEGQDGAYLSPGDTLMFGDMIRYRSQLGLSEDQQMRCLKQIAEADIGYACISWDTIIHMDGMNCYSWNFRTGEPLMQLSMLDLVNPFPPLHSSIIQATTSWPLRTLVTCDGETWYAQPRRDWPSLPDLVLQDIISDLDCAADFHAFACTCKSWWLASSLYPRPLLLHPFATPTWLFVTPGGRWNNPIANFRLFPALRMKEHSTLIGGSMKFLIFLENSSCYIVNIHTGQSKELHVPCCGVQRGVISTPAESANSNILLVTQSSVLCKSINGSDPWRVQDFGDIHVGPIDDIVFVGETAYLIDNRESLYIITPSLEIIFWPLGKFHLFAPTENVGFGRGFRSHRSKLICCRNWLLEHRGELLRLFLSSYSLDMDTEVRYGLFMSRIGSDDMREFFKMKSEKSGLSSLAEKWPAEAWIKMKSADLGEASVFLNNGNFAASFVSEQPGRWGLKSGQVFMCGPDVFPWLSFDFGWAREGDVIPESIRWPCPVFLDSGFSFAAAEELDYCTLFDKAPEPTALNLDSAASSSHTLPSEAGELSSDGEAN